MATPPTEPRIWRHRTGELQLGRRTLLMGIVNVTPDSFSDGGSYLDAGRAAEHALKLAAEGADLVDLGAESTRPGSEAVAAPQQLERLLPVLERLSGSLTIPISVDTTSAEVAAEVLARGASIINDISGFHFDPQLPRVCAQAQAGVVLMHIRGVPRSMQQETEYADLIGEVHEYLQEGVRRGSDAGIGRDRMLVDPGIGFGKSFEQNYALLDGMARFRDLAAGVLAGPSRKGFTGEFSKRPASERQFSTAAAVALAVLSGADVVRVHDVSQMREVTDIVDRFREIQARGSG